MLSRSRIYRIRGDECEKYVYILRDKIRKNLEAAFFWRRTTDVHFFSRRFVMAPLSMATPASPEKACRDDSKPFERK